MIVLLNLTTPAPNAVFTAPASGDPPSVPFATDGSGPHDWSWSLRWGDYTHSGHATTPGNRWDGGSILANRGGRLEVKVGAHRGKLLEFVSVVVEVRGTNPTAAGVDAYLLTCAGSDGFARIIAHESKYRHFTAAGEPVRSFDNGVGMCQLTTPVATIEQAWNWRRNVDAGLALFAQKRASALKYLSQAGREHSPAQLVRESVCGWNGGRYHVWDAAAMAWTRPANILCDLQTGNIGWDTASSRNRGKTAAQLRARDKGSYASGHGGGNWAYRGVCYADSLLG